MGAINALRTHYDGWKSYLTSLGGRSDKSQALGMVPQTALTWQELTNIYMGDGIGTSVVDVVADDMIRNGFEITGDQKGQLMLVAKNLGLKAAINTAAKWMRLYGGAVILLETSDSEPDYAAPLPEKYKVTGLKVYAASRIFLTLSDFNLTNPSQPYFDEPFQYNLYNKWTGSYFTVHRSRCVPFRGKVVPDFWSNAIDINVRYWGVSVLQFCKTALSGAGAFMQGLSHLGQEMTIGKFKMTGLARLFAEKDYKGVMKRISMINAAKSSINAVVLDKDEDYIRDSLTFTGVGDAVDRFFAWVSGTTRIPVSRLFGSGAKGLGVDDEGDSRNYYDMVKSDQETYLQPPTLELLAKINKSLSFVVPETELGLTWNPVWTPTQQQEVTMRNTQAQTDKIYAVDIGCLSQEQIFDNRFKKGWSYETQVDGESGFFGTPEPKDVGGQKPGEAGGTQE